MAKSTMSMAIFNSKLLARGYHVVQANAVVAIY